MAADKDAAKRRRQARNRQERSKRQTRVEGAARSEARPARTADTVAAKGKGGAKKAEPAGSPIAPRSQGGLLGYLFPKRPTAEGDARSEETGRPSRSAAARPGRTETTAAAGREGRPSRAQPKESVIIDAGEAGEAGGARGWIAVRMSQPGGRPVMLALFVSIVSAVTLLAFPVLPRFAFEYYGETVVEASAAHSGQTDAATTAMVDAFDDGGTISAGTSRLIEVAPLAYALVFSLIPVIICLLAVSSLTKATRSRTLLISALAAAMYVFFSQGIGTFFILGVAALGFGAYKSRKADAMAVADAA